MKHEFEWTDTYGNSVYRRSLHVHSPNGSHRKATAADLERLGWMWKEEVDEDEKVLAKDVDYMRELVALTKRQAAALAARDKRIEEFEADLASSREPLATLTSRVTDLRERVAKAARQYFAGLAMQEMVKRCESAEHIEDACVEAYRWADAMVRVGAEYKPPTAPVESDT